MKKVLLLFIVFLYIIPVKANNIVKLSNSIEICDAVKSNSRLKIKVYNGIEDKTYDMPSPTNNCSNTPKYEENINNIKNGASFVAFYRGAYPNKIYIDDVLVKDANVSNSYSYFVISNQARNQNADRNNTLKPSEKVFMDLDIKDKNIKSNTYKDLRLSIQYGSTSSDTNISFYDSISYYVYANNKTYGPYRLAFSRYDNMYREVNTGNKTSIINVYTIVSDNLLSQIPSGLSITGIKIVPYDNYTIRRGYLKIFNMSLDGYSKYQNGNSYVTVNNIEDVTRHNIVNNMIENATVKWNVVGPNKLYFYCSLCSSPTTFKSGEIYYGIPYVNTINTTISSFTNQMTKNSKSSNNAYFSYKVPTNYLIDEVALNGKKIKKGEAIDTNVGSKIGNSELNNTLFVYEGTTSQHVTDSNGNKTKRGKDFENDIPFVSNSGSNYFPGLDCSSSTFLAIARELPYVTTVAGSTYYFYNSQVELLGDLSFSTYGVEKYLRDKKILSKTDQMTLDTLKEYYDEFIRNDGKINASSKDQEAKAQKVYNAYGLLVPGDIVAGIGHVRMETGYPHVVCNDGTIVGGVKTQKYSNNYCSSHGGINPNESYVIITEVGGSPSNRKYTKDSSGDYVRTNSKGNIIEKNLASNHTGWSFSLNKNITDITKIDDYFASGRLTTFRINKIYTFKDLYYTTGSVKIYMPFRYKALNNLIQSKQVEVPYAKLALDKEYSNPSNEVLNYMKNNKQLKGTIITNYIIDEIKFEINGKNYFVYPLQTNTFSLFSDIEDDKILSAIRNLDYTKNFKVKVSVKTGANVKELNNDYIDVININYQNSSKTSIKGDIDGNGKVETSDYLLIRKHLMYLSTLTGDMLKRADVDGSNSVTSGDYIAIRKILLGYE